MFEVNLYLFLRWRTCDCKQDFLLQFFWFLGITQVTWFHEEGNTVIFLSTFFYGDYMPKWDPFVFAKSHLFMSHHCRLWNLFYRKTFPLSPRGTGFFLHDTIFFSNSSGFCALFQLLIFHRKGYVSLLASCHQ